MPRPRARPGGEAPGVVDGGPMADVLGDPADGLDLGAGQDQVVPAGGRLDPLGQVVQVGATEGPADIPGGARDGWARVGGATGDGLCGGRADRRQAQAELGGDGVDVRRIALRRSGPGRRARRPAARPASGGGRRSRRPADAPTGRRSRSETTTSPATRSISRPARRPRADRRPGRARRIRPGAPRRRRPPRAPRAGPARPARRRRRGSGRPGSTPPAGRPPPRAAAATARRSAASGPHNWMSGIGPRRPRSADQAAATRSAMAACDGERSPASTGPTGSIIPASRSSRYSSPTRWCSTRSSIRSGASVSVGPAPISISRHRRSGDAGDRALQWASGSAARARLNVG